MLRTLILTLVLAIFCQSIDAQHTNALSSRLQTTLDSLASAGDYPGATFTAILPDGKSIELATGYADVEKQTPMPPDGRMFSGSTGKTYVSAIMMQLIDEGKLDVNTLVSDYFNGESWFENLPNASTMKVHHLLNHTSGLPRYVFKPTYWETFNKDRLRKYPPKELLSFVAGDEPTHPVGEGWGYSDTGYLVIGLIIEKITGKAYYDVVTERIFDKLDFKATSTSTSRTFPGLVQGYTGDHVAPYDLPPLVVEDGQYIFDPSFEYCGGGVVTNAPELARWTKMLYEGEIFSESRLKELLTPVDFRTGKPAKAGYGYGVFVYQTPKGPAWGHSGFFFGYQTELLYLPDVKCALALQVNADQTSGKVKVPTMRTMMVLANIVRTGMGVNTP